MGSEWVIVAIVAVVVIFGVNKLPQIARNLGKAQNEFKQGLKEGVGRRHCLGEPQAGGEAADHLIPQRGTSSAIRPRIPFTKRFDSSADSSAAASTASLIATDGGTSSR